MVGSAFAVGSAVTTAAKMMSECSPAQRITVQSSAMELIFMMIPILLVAAIDLFLVCRKVHSKVRVIYCFEGSFRNIYVGHVCVY